MDCSLSARYSSDPFYHQPFYPELTEPRDLTVTIEEREPLDELSVMVSYAVHLSYVSESRYEVKSFDLIRSRRDCLGRLVSSKTPLEHLTHTEIRVGLDAMFREDVLSPEVVEIIGEAIISDMRKHDEIARDEAADLRRADRFHLDTLDRQARIDALAPPPRPTCVDIERAE